MVIARSLISNSSNCQNTARTNGHDLFRHGRTGGTDDFYERIDGRAIESSDPVGEKVRKPRRFRAETSSIDHNARLRFPGKLFQVLGIVPDNVEVTDDL